MLKLTIICIDGILIRSIRKSESWLIDWERGYLYGVTTGKILYSWGFLRYAGVREYWIIDAEQNKIHVYDMQDNKLVLNHYTFQDTIKVGIYEDFYIDFSSLNL